jgi:hypothetical protein
MRGRIASPHDVPPGAVPSVIDRGQLAAAYALWPILLQVGAVAGPARAGVLLARFGLAPLVWLDAVSFGASFVAVRRMAPLPPARPEAGGVAGAAGVAAVAAWVPRFRRFDAGQEAQEAGTPT